MATDVLFLTQNLDSGGSQRQLAVVAKGLADRGFNINVAVFRAGGSLQSSLESAGVRVTSLRKGGRWDIAGLLLSLRRLAREERPRVAHGYLDAANVLTLVVRYFEPGTRAIWGVRSAQVDWSQYDLLTQLMFKGGCVLARRADLVIVNSRAGRDYHVARGYPPDKTVVVQNGIDTRLFRPDAEARSRLRREWGIDDADLLIGLIARLDPLKGHETFLGAAASLIADQRFKFVCVGGGTNEFAATLRQRSELLGLEGRVIWAGERSDINAVYNALDIAASTSIGEGFSNVIAEAMASGVPCVVTATGDSAEIVGDTGFVVDVGDAEALASALQKLSVRLGPALRERCRRRIVSEFGVERLVDHTIQALNLDAVHPKRSLATAKAASAR